MRSLRRWPFAAVPGLFVLALALPGCGESEPDNIVHVQGTVTFDGKPIPIGMVIFEPDPSKGGKGPQGHAEIRDGKFDTSAANGKGAAIGAQIVHISGGDGVNPDTFTPLGSLLFEEHTVRMELSKDQAPLTIDVPGPKSKKTR